MSSPAGECNFCGEHVDSLAQIADSMSSVANHPTRRKPMKTNDVRFSTNHENSIFDAGPWVSGVDFTAHSIESGAVGDNA